MHRAKTRGTFCHNTAWENRGAAQTYDARRFSSWSGRLFNRMEQAAIAQILAAVENKSVIRTVLDVPCGTGRISELLLQRNYVVTCGDISKEMLMVAQKRFENISREVFFCQVNIYKMPFDDDSFDCVTCIRLFQHLTSDERARALMELGRVSRRYVVANIMYTSSYYGVVRGLRRFVGRYAPRHTCSEVELARASGFANVKVVKRRFPQPLYNSNLVLLFEK